jgi:hypothetical protein
MTRTKIAAWASVCQDLPPANEMPVTAGPIQTRTVDSISNERRPR